MKKLFLELRVPFNIDGNPHHHLHRFTGIISRSCFRRQHDRVGTIEDRVGNIGRLGAGRSRVIDHALQHLGCRDDRLTGQVTLPDDMLLDQGNFFRVDLHTQITARHHDTVGRCEDFSKSFHRFRFLNLGDHLDRRLSLREKFFELDDFCRRTHKGESQVVKLLLYAKL